ncbi:RNase adapter RapZ [Actinomyces sp. zg-332]|uniref:RNase adapter RapZ n=1 Tax=Actinomyces sp. zg-332 TaxID=2708340 RepID=UPI001423CC4F|nr:RNase adapter RapZ [Actinomyces sp. zg-332]QPK93760.1 RNase adapter RapZ [Actinomyces sp. zg-332]
MIDENKEASDLTFPEGIPLLDALKEPEVSVQPEMIIVSGMSGAGRTRAAMALEDLDWYVVDNLPPQLLMAFAGMMTANGGGVHRLAAVVDVRSKGFFSQLLDCLDSLQTNGIRYRVIFLEADERVLVRRYESVRRPHPLQKGGRILDGVRAEKKMLEGLRSKADIIIDTSNKSVHDLSREIRRIMSDEDSNSLRVTVMSFGFKYGIPVDADWVVDMRFLANPYWVSELRHLTGKDKPVSDYVISQEGAKEFANSYLKALRPALNGYLNELKPFVTIAVGCTGGQHRSVAMSEYFSEALRQMGLPVVTLHRDMGRE